jgi:peptidyl-prolyl cis-trans isomerase B (cyclophilin B)
VTSLKDRQRAAARAKLEREMALRQENAVHRRRRTWVGVSATIGVIVVVGAVVAVVSSTGGKPAAKPAAIGSVGPAKCTWTPNPNPSASPSPTAGTPVNKYLIKTGTPPTTGIPDTGTRTMTLTSKLGVITVALDLAKAPCASESMAFLSSKKFYDGTGCGNLVSSGPYVLLCGDPSNSGEGGPNYSFTPENLPAANTRPNYQMGDVVMLNNGAGNGSQFMFVFKDTPVQTDPSTGTESSLIPSNYTVVGTVTSGLNIVQKVADGGTKAPDATTGASAPKVPLTFQTVTVGPVAGS